MKKRKKKHILKKKFKLFRYSCTDYFNSLLSPIRKRYSGLVNEHEIVFIGLQRTGNHAVLNWIFSQCHELKCFLNYIPAGKNPFIYFQKQGTVKEFKQPDFYEKFNLTLERLGFFSKKFCLLYSYEDELLEDIFSPVFFKNRERWVGKSEKRYNLILLRDPYNLFASRLKKEETIPNKYSLRNPQERAILIKIWKQYAREFIEEESKFLPDKKVVINYNKWFSDKNYRKEIAEKLELDFCDDTVEEVLPIGGGSSFDKNISGSRLKVLERWKFYRDDPLFREIFRDKELRELSDAIFGEIEGVNELFE